MLPKATSGFFNGNLIKKEKTSSEKPDFMKLFPTKMLLILGCVLVSFFLLARNVLAQSTDYIADTRTLKLVRFFQAQNSPLTPFSADFVEQADLNDLDYRLVPAIAGVESTFGKRHLVGTYNVYGWGGGLIPFKSWPDGIKAVSRGLKKGYLDKGAIEVEQISWIYCPPGNLNWAAKVRFFMKKIDETEISINQISPVLALSLTL